MERRVRHQGREYRRTQVGRGTSLLSRRLRMLVDERDADLVICDVGGLTNVDAATVEGLARLQLTAHRMGCDVRLVNASEELHGLLALTGLCDIVGLCDRT